MDSLVVFEMLNSSITPTGFIDDYISLMYTDYENDIGSFEMELPYKEETFNLIKRTNELERLIKLDNNVIGICQKINPVNKDTGEKVIFVQGELQKGLLDRYCVNEVTRLKTATTSPQNILNFPLSLQYELQHPVENISGGLWSGIQYDLPADYDDLSWNMLDGFTGGRCSIEKFISLSTTQLGKSHFLNYNAEFGTFDLVLYTPVNRTISQSNNSPVLLSTDFGNLLSSEYCFNSKEYKNIIVVYTTINGVYYEEVVTYEDMTITYPMSKRRVLYQEVNNIPALNDSGDELSETDIRGLLRQKGKEILYDCAFISEYSCQFAPNSVYTYEKDYFLGDKITIQDKELGVLIDAKITGYTKTKSVNSETFEPIIGVSQPSLTRILKKKGVI